MISISVNVHAQTDANPTFTVTRQELNGTLVLKIESEGIYPSAAIFLDAATLRDLVRAVQRGLIDATPS